MSGELWPSSGADTSVVCSICGRRYVPTGRQRYCSDSCRQRAWRQRQQPLVVAPLSSPPGTPARAVTIYECPACEARLLEQRCPDCNSWAKRIGYGGLCPHCEELVAFAELVP